MERFEPKALAKEQQRGMYQEMLAQAEAKALNALVNYEMAMAALERLRLNARGSEDT